MAEKTVVWGAKWLILGFEWLEINEKLRVT
jgi:hypothetical protein